MRVSGKVIDVEHATTMRRLQDLTEMTHGSSRLKESYHTISSRSVREVYHDATFGKERSQALFNSGVLSLRGRALAEQLYLATINAVARLAKRDSEEYEDILRDLESTLIDRYFCNFSVFQSLRTVAIDHALRYCRATVWHGGATSRRGSTRAVGHAIRPEDRQLTGGRMSGRLELHSSCLASPTFWEFVFTGAYQKYGAISTTGRRQPTRFSAPSAMATKSAISCGDTVNEGLYYAAVPRVGIL